MATSEQTRAVSKDQPESRPLNGLSGGGVERAKWIHPISLR